MGIKILSSLIFILLMASIVSAAEGVSVQSPKIDLVRQYQNFTFQFTVYNQTTGYPLNNSDVSCRFTLYNSSGTILSSNTPSYLSSRWNINPDVKNFSSLGDRSYLFACNSTTVGGYSSAAFKVSATGLEYTVAQSITYVLLFFVVLLFFLFCSYAFIRLPKKNTRSEKKEVIKVQWRKYLAWFCLIWAYVSLLALTYFSWNISYAFLNFDSLSNFFEATFNIMLGMLRPIIIVSVIMGVVYWLKDRKIHDQLKKGLSYHG